MAMSFTHDPDAILDYDWDWTAWLEADETVDSATVTATEALTLGSDSISVDGKKVTVWVIGADGKGSMTCHIVTSANREDDRTIYLSVRER